jgi:hypothetical protein
MDRRFEMPGKKNVEKPKATKLEKRATPRIIGPKTDKDPHSGKPPR